MMTAAIDSPPRARFPAAWAALGGVLYFLGFVGFGYWPLIFFFLAAFLNAVDGRRPRDAFLLGWLGGIVTMAGGYYWVVHLLREFAHLALPWALVGFALLCVYQGLALGCVTLAATLVHRRWQWPYVVSLPVAFTAVEAFFPFLFPNYAGNTLYVVPVLTQAVELVGMGAMSLLVGGVNGAVFDIIRARRTGAPLRAPVIALASILVTTSIYGAIRIAQVDAAIAAAPKLKVAMVQANLGARDKSGQREEFIRRHRQMTREAVEAHPELDLVVWPESSYNGFLPRERTDLAAVSGYQPVPLLFGAVTGHVEDGRREIFNTAVLTSSTGALAGRFDKMRLLMFGETLPLVETFPEIKSWFPRSSTFTRGRIYEHLPLGDISMLPMICYEDIIPSFVRELWQRAGPADVLVNITNDSWYGDSHEPLTHLALATFRSIETRRAMIRSTNTGISAFVDPVGRITQRTGQWTREILYGEVPVFTSGRTTPYLRTGDWLGWVALVGCLVSFFRRRSAA